MFSPYALSNLLTYKKAINCSIFYDRNFPSQTPIIYGLSQYSSNVADYTTVYITGENFIYGNSNSKSINNTSGTATSTTIVYMTANNGLGEKISIPTIFYSSTYISFVVPSNISIGNYVLKVGVKSTISGGNGTGMAAATNILLSNNEIYNLT